MSLFSPLQQRLDNQLNHAQSNLDRITEAASDGNATPADSLAFYEASMGCANASWAANQELTVRHGLAKAIINESN